MLGCPWDYMPKFFSLHVFFKWSPDCSQIFPSFQIVKDCNRQNDGIPKSQNLGISHATEQRRIQAADQLGVSWLWDGVLNHPVGPSVITRVRSERGRQGRRRAGVMQCEKTHWPVLALKMEGTTGQGMWVASRSSKGPESRSRCPCLPLPEPPKRNTAMLILWFYPTDTHFRLLTSRTIR